MFKIPDHNRIITKANAVRAGGGGALVWLLANCGTPAPQFPGNAVRPAQVVVGSCLVHRVNEQTTYWNGGNMKALLKITGVNGLQANGEQWSFDDSIANGVYDLNKEIAGGGAATTVNLADWGVTDSPTKENYGAFSACPSVPSLGAAALSGGIADFVKSIEAQIGIAAPAGPNS